PDGMSITVQWTTGGSAKLERIELDQQADRVTIGVVERVFNGPNTADARGAEQTVKLAAPLGDRAVYDPATRLPPIQQGPNPGEPACPPPPPPLTRLQAMIQQRTDQGLRADPAYVQSLIGRGVAYTRAESAWLQKREKLGDQNAIDRYLGRHHGESGGWTVAGTFPGKPYVLVRVTKRPAYHLAQLRKLTKASVKVVTVAYPLDALYPLSDRIASDAKLAGGFFDGYGNAGFRFLSSDVDEDAGTVVVDAITPRADAAAYFQARYGPVVQVRL